MTAVEAVKYSRRRRLFIGLVTVLGIATMVSSLAQRPDQSWSLLVYAALGGLLSAIRIRQVLGAASLGTLFVLLALQELNLASTILVGCTVIAGQIWSQPRMARTPAPVLFHLANMAIGIDIAYRIHHEPWISGGQNAVSLAIAAAMLYGWLNLAASLDVALANQLKLTSVVRECTIRTFPQYLTGVFTAMLIPAASVAGLPHLGWLVVPGGLLAYSVYAAEQSREASNPIAAEDVKSLHLRTMEALAMVIEARDLTSAGHLRRLQFYCGEIGAELKLSSKELEALRTAALLHDVGKLAVPEHILAKGGRLTREEFEAVKIHADVGAEIVESMRFPYPAAEIVRSHHERWNGSGYPRALKGEQIPIGARILGAVDTLDALLTEKPYRAALSIESAIDRLAAEAGVTFDPQVVDVLARRYAQWEEELTLFCPVTLRDDLHRLKEAFGPPRAEAPLSAGMEPGDHPKFLSRIAKSREEAQTILEITQELGKSLQLDESLPGLVKRLQRLIPFDSCVIYLLNDKVLTPRYAAGESTSLLMSRHLTIGLGVVGSVAQNGRAILNGMLAEDFSNGPSTRRLPLSVGLAVPLIGSQATVGVLLLGRRGPQGFTEDHLRIAMAIHAKLGAALENAVNYEKARLSASTDFLTGLPNARSLQLQLESELARCRRLNTTLTVLVTDLDGFKEVNDRFGHLDGNRVLQAVAKAMRHSCREYDYVARMGGDEFVFILPGLGDNDIPLKIAQLNRAVAEAGRSVVPESRIGLSVGEARYPEQGRSAEELLLDADQRMYKVKMARKMRHRNSRRGFVFDEEKCEIPTDH
jgi:diguanylate cyclase (GGDEF)-like protein/putative nucleotidyltransferase with HDIG domain